MKKQKIKVNGIRYKYIITDDNNLRFDETVSPETCQIIKERLIKQGKYQDKKSENIIIHHNENYLKRRFQKWTKIELKLYLEELEEKHRNNTITSEEKLLVQSIREEIERRSKNDKSRND